MKSMINKKWSFGLVLGVLIITSVMSCKKDFLDRQPLGQYTTGSYPYPTGSGPYDQYIFAAYADMRAWGYSVFGFVGATSIRSDDADKGSTPADAATQIEMDNFPVTPTNSLTNDLWTAYYSAITKCNVVLNQVATDSTATEESVKSSARAEARFLRGYSYFMLVRLFGKVPLVDTVLTNAAGQSNIPQSDAATIYAFVEQDLQYAAANLPSVWPDKFVGRATSGSANGILAKVYLYEKKWAQAMGAASLVINSGNYDLSTSYDKIFSEDGENSKESVFEIQAYADVSHKQDSYGVQYANVQGVRGSNNADLGWGFNVPSVQLAAAYETGDPRKDRTILYTPSATPTMYGETFPAETNPMYNKKVYTNPSVRGSVGDRFGWWMNIRILRYADVLLMYAEAANEQNMTTEALAKVNMVRARARGGDNTILPDITVTDQAALRTAIQHERRVELGMEHERFFDIVRWGIASDVLHNAGKSNYLIGRDEVLPIPQAQIDLSKGVLVQNNGY